MQPRFLTPHLTAALTAAALIWSPLGATAQQAPAAPTPGEPFLGGTYGDWQIVCTIFEEGGEAYCDMAQMLLDDTGNPTAEISITALPPGGEVVAAATITTPLETFLPFGLAFRIDDGLPRFEGFRVCTIMGCLVRMGLSADEVALMQRGTQAQIAIAPFVQIDQPVELPISLSGFTAALEDLRARPTFAQ